MPTTQFYTFSEQPEFVLPPVFQRIYLNLNDVLANQLSEDFGAAPTYYNMLTENNYIGSPVFRPANETRVGDTFMIQAYGSYYSTTGPTNSPTVTFRFGIRRLDNTFMQILDQSFNIPHAHKSTPASFRIEIVQWIDAIGPAGTAQISSKFTFRIEDQGSNYEYVYYNDVTENTVFDTTTEGKSEVLVNITGGQISSVGTINTEITFKKVTVFGLS